MLTIITQMGSEKFLNSGKVIKQVSNAVNKILKLNVFPSGKKISIYDHLESMRNIHHK